MFNRGKELLILTGNIAQQWKEHFEESLGKVLSVDEICPEMPKALVELSSLTCLSSVVWRLGTVPVDWQTRVVVTSFRKGTEGCAPIIGILYGKASLGKLMPGGTYQLWTLDPWGAIWILSMDHCTWLECFLLRDFLKSICVQFQSSRLHCDMMTLILSSTGALWGHFTLIRTTCNNFHALMHISLACIYSDIRCHWVF